MKWLLIGVSGATCSGKTSVARKVNESIKGSILINQDSYFLSKDDPRHILVPELNHLNWEILTSLDMPKMHLDILKVIDSNNLDTEKNDANEKIKVLIIEGFSIFNYKPIADICSLKFFIEINKEICWSRRKIRVYDPPDVPGYFDKVVWPEYLKHKSDMISNENLKKSIKFLDGTKHINELYNDIIKEVKTFL